MEFLDLLNKIDSDEGIGETWIEALIRQFHFPESPLLFQTLVHLNSRIKTAIQLHDSNFLARKEARLIVSLCDCSLPPIFDVWYFTKHFPIEKTRLVLIIQSPAVCKNVSGIPILPNILETHWANQGVFLLRSYVSPECQNEEHLAWRVLTDNLIEYMANNNPSILFVLLVGGKGEKNNLNSFHNPLDYLLKDSRRFLMVEGNDATLPENQTDFQQTKPILFQLCNQKLKELGNDPIQWNLEFEA